MPAILTHDFFARDTLDAFGQHVEDSTLDERDAFLLGNQGPDPLFFLILRPSMAPYRNLGSRMHREHTTELLHALSQALGVLQEHELPVGRAYAQGFLGHFVSDSYIHPLIYSFEHAICHAGIEGLSSKNAHEVHAEIERELDEMVLTTKRGQTVRNYPVVDNTLEASPETLAIIQKMYAYLALSVYGIQIPKELFSTAVEAYRIVLASFHSPFGLKRALAMTLEQRVRPYSLFGAMAHKAHLVEDSWFANTQHDEWTHPFTGEIHADSFWDLYNKALDAQAEAIELFENRNFSLGDARTITHELNFKGEPLVPLLIVED